MMVGAGSQTPLGELQAACQQTGCREVLLDVVPGP